MIERVLLEEIVVEIRNGLDAEQVDQPSNGMLPISRIETIWNGTIDFERVKYANVSKKEIDKYALKSGDILFSHINSPEHIGKTGLYRSEQTLIHGINLLLIRVDQEKCYPEYLDYYFKSKNVRALFRARCKKAVNQASLNQSDILALELPLPPLDEQKRIASLLARADRLRGLRRAARQLADSLLQSVFLEMFGEERSNKFEDLLLEEIIADCQSGFASGERSDNGVIQLRMNNVTTNGQLDWSSFIRVPTTQKQVEKYQLRQGDILFNSTNSPELVGKSALFKDKSEPVVFSNHFLRLRVDETKIHPVYLAQWLVIQWQERVFESLCTQWVNQAAVRKEDLLSLRLSVPPLPLQEEFARVAARVEGLRARQAEAERQAEGVFQSLLAEAFA